MLRRAPGPFGTQGAAAGPQQQADTVAAVITAALAGVATLQVQTVAQDGDGVTVTLPPKP